MEQSRSLVLMNQSDEAERRRKAWEMIQNAAAEVIADLNREISVRIQRREPLERRWMEDLRQYHGIYEPDVLAILREDKERSQVFINITRPKTNAWRARIGDMLFPNDERNWGIDPTPVPTLTQEARRAAKQADQMEAQVAGIVAQNNADVEAGGPGMPDEMAAAMQTANLAAQLRAREKQLQANIEEARRRSAAMQREIDDQLTEARYPSKCRDVIDDMVKVGSGIIKGPVVSTAPKRTWDIDSETGDALLSQGEPNQPTVRRVNFWHFFPDPDAETIEEGNGTFERHLPNRKMLKRMARDLGFDPRTVGELLKEGPRTNGPGQRDVNWMAELRELEGSATSADMANTLADRWCVWEFHGALEADQIARMIRAMGRFPDAERFEEAAEQNPLREYMVRVFFCGNRLLKIEEDYLLDSGASVYSVATFEKSESSILGGVGVPRLMRSEQAMLNSAVRMMMDNAALATGPQIVIDKEIIGPANGKWKLTPRKVWHRIKSAVMAEREGNRPFEMFDIPMNQEMLANIIALATKFVDEAVAMPLIAQGDQAAHITQTAHGMSMLFNSANVVFRRVIKNWDDDVTTGLIQRFFDFNMQFSNKIEIKGDAKIEARGTSVLLVREMQADQMMTILQQWSTHPILGVGLRAYNCMRLVLQAMNINPDDVLINEEEYLQKLQGMGDQQDDGTAAAELQAAQMDADTKLQVAQISADSRRDVAQVTLAAAQLNQETEFAKLAQQREISVEQVSAMFKSKQLDARVKLIGKKLETDSKERMFAGEIGAEAQMAREARARGEEPTGSGGFVSAGGKPA